MTYDSWWCICIVFIKYFPKSQWNFDVIQLFHCPSHITNCECLQKISSKNYPDNLLGVVPNYFLVPLNYTMLQCRQWANFGALNFIIIQTALAWLEFTVARSWGPIKMIIQPSFAVRFVIVYVLHSVTAYFSRWNVNILEYFITFVPPNSEGYIEQYFIALFWRRTV